MNNVLLTMEDSINLGKGKKIAVTDLLKVKGGVFEYIKNGYQFDDEVLEKAHIKKTIRNQRVTGEFATPRITKTKTYEKDTESLKNILKSINTLENPKTNNNDDEDDNISLIGEEQ